ncbi:ABC transporter permease [Brevibacterium album]|uniref:ABC transporter permease n=1 Tax=Brevibacterium album TaxID=417948 RepID=UPI0004221D01|nr:ABC transporter permease [Brevibacterium album]
MRALITKEFRELARDKRTLAMLILLPVLLLTIFGYAANFSVDRVQTAVVGPEAEALAAELSDHEAAEDGLDLAMVDAGLDRSDGERLLREGEVQALVVSTGPAAGADGSGGDGAGGSSGSSDSGAGAGTEPDAPAPLTDRMHVYLDGSSLFTAQAAQRTFAQLAGEEGRQRAEQVRASVIDALQAHAEAAPGPEGERASDTGNAPGPAALPDLAELAPETDLDPEEFVTVLFNPDLETSWVMVPGLIGLILTFIGMIITSIGLVRERETGTLEQLAVMPLAPSSIILGKIAPYFLLALLDMVIVTLLGVWLFGVPFAGSVWVFALAAFVFLFVVLGMGVLVSSVSQNTGQAIQMAIMLLLPQVLLSGLIFPLESMAAGVRWIGYILPLTWFTDIARGIMLRDAPLEALWLPFGVLAVMAVLIFGLATLRMRLSLTRGGAR